MTSLEPDTKDWTWTLQRPCPGCGLDARAIAPEAVPGAITAYTSPWAEVLRRPDARTRPDAARWSPLEYACHVRDVCRLFDRRVRRMLAEDDPLFENWDQDATAIEDRYGEQDPATVAAEVLEAADAYAGTYRAVTGAAWDRPGRRSDGSRFTVLSLGRYGLHDLAHHLHDVGVTPAALPAALPGVTPAAAPGAPPPTPAS
jgi:hypothetical protein